MANKVDPKKVILNTSNADVAQGSASWYDIEGSDKVLFFVTITGTATVKIDCDHNGDGASYVEIASLTASDQKVMDDPTGRVRAYTTGVGAGESAKVEMRRVFNNWR